MDSLVGALNKALRDAMSDDPSIVVLGLDVGTLGGVFRVTAGLAEQFGTNRCFDTPLSESGIVGCAVGMAMNGLRPIVELQFDAFAYPAFEQIVSHVAKFRYRTAGRVHLPMVIRIPVGGGVGAVEHHSDSSEAYYIHTPGLTVVTPADASDGYTLLRHAIASSDPVIFLEPKSLYWAKEALQRPGPATTPPYRAFVRRAGTTATILAYGASVGLALRTAEAAASRGWDLEVIDLRSLSPLDVETIVASVQNTGRCLVVHEAPGFGGFGAELAAQITENCFFHLEAPVLRVTGLDTPYPPPLLEEHYLPSVDRILTAIGQLVDQT